MNYTKNYHLPQWAEEDRIQMQDFNQMCADMEAGLTANKAIAEQLPYVVGSYTGTGADVTIELGFRPSFVIVNGITSTDGTPTASLLGRSAASGGNVCSDVLEFTDTGFQAKYIQSTTPKVAESGRVYDYIAFK